MINDRYRQRNIKAQIIKRNKIINNKYSLNYCKKQQEFLKKKD